MVIKILLFLMLLSVSALADSTVVTGTTDLDDALLAAGGNSDNNYGSRTDVLINGSIPFNGVFRVNDLATLVGADKVMDSARLYLRNLSGGISAIYGAYRIHKPWVEGDEDGADNDDGDVTYNDWASDADEWGTAGCNCAGDDGVDNTQDGNCNASGRDRRATAESTVDIDDVDVYFPMKISQDVVQGWYTGDYVNNGILLKYISGSTSTKTIISTEAASNQTYWVIYHQAAASGGQKIMIRK